MAHWSLFHSIALVLIKCQILVSPRAAFCHQCHLARWWYQGCAAVAAIAMQAINFKRDSQASNYVLNVTIMRSPHDAGARSPTLAGGLDGEADTGLMAERGQDGGGQSYPGSDTPRGSTEAVVACRRRGGLAISNGARIPHADGKQRRGKAGGGGDVVTILKLEWG